MTQTDNTQPIEAVLAQEITRRFKDANGPIVIAVGGPGGTGKSRLSRRLAALLPDSVVLCLDDYKTARAVRAELGIFGPHPAANEMEMIEEHLAMVKSGLGIEKPVYNSEAGHADRTEHFAAHRITIADGEVSTYAEFRHLVDFSIFIDADLQTQKKTRLTRDIEQRGYSREKAMATFHGSNVREFGEYGLPTKEWVDTVLFCNADYTLSCDGMSEAV